MTRLAPLEPDTATGAARDMLTELVDRHGTVGMMVRTMAHSPAVLGGYLQLSRAARRSKVSREISERISLAVQQHMGCAVCLAAHTDAARGIGVSEAEIQAARQGYSSDPKISAMVAYGLQVYVAPATITDKQIAELLVHGYTHREIADVVAIVALNVLTGAFNLVAGLSSGERIDS